MQSINSPAHAVRFTGFAAIISAVTLSGMVGIMTGCGNGNLAQVEGTITMDGKPLASASVLFVHPEASPSGARTDDKGFYRLSYGETEMGALPGKYTVRVSTVVGANIDDQGKPVPGKKETVPARYNSQTTLEFEVVKGKKNIANFDLDSKGPIESSE